MSKLIDHLPKEFIKVDEWIMLRNFIKDPTEALAIYMHDMKPRGEEQAAEFRRYFKKRTPELLEQYKVVQYEKFLVPDGKLILVEFDKLFNGTDKLNTFILKKESYVTQAQKFCDYVNYFLTYYDTEKEVILAYLKIKYLVNDIRSPINREGFIDLVMRFLFTTSIREKITRMVEDNYDIDVEDNTTKYDPTLEYRNVHVKLLMKISMSMNLLIPVLLDYVNRSQMPTNQKSLYPFYKSLFYLYDTHIDIYNKLYLTVRQKVNLAEKNNRKIFEQKEALGETAMTYIDRLVKENIICEAMPRYNFSQNCIKFNSVILDRQIRYFTKEKYPKTPVELSHLPDESGLTGIDRMEINTVKLDESNIILSNLNIPDTIKRIRSKIAINVPPEEINYYVAHHEPNKFQIELMHYFYARHFNGFNDLNLVQENYHFELLILMKRKLQLQGSFYLPQLLTANFTGKLNMRNIQNTKFLSKIENSDIFKELMENNFYYLKEIGKENDILNYLSIMLNNTFTYVDYDMQDQLGEEIEVNSDFLSDEYLNLIKQF